jgi:hypothetical protein
MISPRSFSVSSSTLLHLLLLLLGTLSIVQAASSEIPIVTSSVICNSTLISDGGFTATLTPEITFHWKLKPDYVLEGALQYMGQGWVGLGFSEDGNMIGSKAVLGIPGVGGQGKPKLYDLMSKQEDASGVQMSTVSNDLTGAVVQVGQETTMVFQTSDWHTTHYEDGMYTFLFAVGYDNNLGFHKHHGRFRVDLRECKGTGSQGASHDDDLVSSLPASSISSIEYDHRSAFVAHGVFATLAFCLIIPAAIGSAVFRSRIPKLWIYIHVLCNCLAFLFAIIAVGTAFGGMVLRANASGTAVNHMTHAHHWVGLTLFIVMSWQVLIGFRRPSVEPKPEFKGEHGRLPEDDLPPTCCGIAKPETPREKWHFIHRLSAILLVALALFQVPSGIKLYKYEYSNDNPKAALTAYWVWVILLTSVFVGMHCLERRKEERNSQIFRHVTPQREEEETARRHNNGLVEINEFSHII